jgi:predicted DNA-binding transcriptional regulator AlpA
MVVDIAGEELIDAAEVAARLGLKSARTVLDLRVHRLGFPAPVARQGRALLWSSAQVDLWGMTASDALARSTFCERAATRT